MSNENEVTERGGLRVRHKQQYFRLHFKKKKKKIF